MNRGASLAFIAMIGVGILVYGAPRWLFAQLTHGQVLAPFFDYDPAFQSTRLRVLFALWIQQAVLLALLVVRGRWNALLCRVDVALEMGVVAVLIWKVAAGRRRQSDNSSRTAGAPPGQRSPRSAS